LALSSFASSSHFLSSNDVYGVVIHFGSMMMGIVSVVVAITPYQVYERDE
jgi:hypothetical protein